ncbi:putative TonB-dependent receptor [Flavihumibacter petaseus NBRC 106054]|uniref:Putative TonB-dependent receptor n=2 Tax=Flavihumibacter TaxID=1004301 RepID=A0A0E9N421_9BACT|nr:putative TonB-dependent receptor [Flavihumibacter petaseus NBRC 106054]
MIASPDILNAQPDTTRTGKLTNDIGEPVAGATILNPRTGQSAVANAKGEFQVTTFRKGDRLIITSIGYEQKVYLWSGTNPVVIVMQRTAQGLDNVTVRLNSGYQYIPKERSTGSYVSLDEKQLNLQPGTNIINRLEGVANSVLFDKDPNRPPVTIRGYSSINGPKNPLIVLDNFPYEGDINNINPNDVESITILRDAAAASIWGTRAGNGVIVITTKKGKLNQPLKIELNANVTVTGKPDLFYLPEINASDFIDVEQALFDRGFYQSQISNRGRPPLSPVEEILVKKANGELTAEEATRQVNAYRDLDVRRDFNEYLYRPGIMQQYALNLQGGTAKASWFVSGGYDRNSDALSAEYERINLRVRNSFRPLPKFQVQTALAYCQSKTESGKSGYNSIRVGTKKLYPYAQFRDGDGNPVPLYMNRQPYIDTAGEGLLLDWKYYPLEEYRYNTAKSDLNEITANVSLQYELLKGLTLEGNYQFQKQLVSRLNLQEQESYVARDLINSFSQVDYSTGIVYRIVPLGAINNTSTTDLTAHQGRGQLNYSKTAGRHELAALAGMEIRQTKTETNRYQYYGFDPETQTIGAIDYTKPYPNFIRGNQFIPKGYGAGFQVQRFTAAFANAAYTYDNRYTVTGSIRKDASNLFGVKSNEKGIPLWSAGLGWTISKEGFYNSTFLPMLRLRTSYGINGNVDNSKSAVTSIFHLGNDTYSNLPFSSVAQYPNPSLSWEKVQIFNVGLDFQLKDNVLSGSIEYFNKTGTDLIGLAPVDYTTGVGSSTGAVIRNVADMKSAGVDLQLNARLLNRSLKWFQSLNLNFNKSRITQYYNATQLARIYVSNGTAISPLVGKPIYSILNYSWAGLDPGTGDPLGYVDGKPGNDYIAIQNDSAKNLAYAGPATPTCYGNFMNTFSWKNFSLSINLQYKLGYYFQRPSISYDALYYSWAGHADYARRWQKPGDEAFTTVPSMPYPADGNRDAFYQASEVLATKADHIRLQFVSLSWDLPTAKSGRSPFRLLQVYGNASNLGIIWSVNHKGLDPDFPSSIPNPKRFTIGFRAHF